MVTIICNFFDNIFFYTFDNLLKVCFSKNKYILSIQTVFIQIENNVLMIENPVVIKVYKDFDQSKKCNRDQIWYSFDTNCLCILQNFRKSDIFFHVHKQFSNFPFKISLFSVFSLINVTSLNLSCNILRSNLKPQNQK